MGKQHAPAGRAHEDPSWLAATWRAVKRWPGLRGEAKLAWRFLVEFAGGQSTTITIMAADVAADQGTSERSGLRALESLALEGLVELVERTKGRWTIYLPDPLDVARARRSRGCDGQGELFPDLEEPLAEEPTSPPTGLALRAPAADVAQHPPRRADFDFSARASKDLDLDLSEDFNRSAQADAAARSQRSPRETRGGSGATSAAERIGAAARIGAVLPPIGEPPAAALSAGRRELRTDSLEAYVRWLKGRVGEIGDESKFESFAAKVARLVFDPALSRRFDDDTVADVLLSLDRKRRAGELRCAYAFFVRCIQRKLADQRLSF